MPDEITLTISRDIAVAGIAGFTLGWLCACIMALVVIGRGKGHDSSW